MRNISWNEATEMCHKLSDAIKADCYSPDIIIGITRGGLVPLAIVSYDLNVRNIQTIALRFYNEDKRSGQVEQLVPLHLDDLAKYVKVLVVDDVADTGETIGYVLSKLENREVRVATLMYKPKNSKVKPDYFVEETDDWVNFPWGV